MDGRERIRKFLWLAPHVDFAGLSFQPWKQVQARESSRQKMLMHLTTFQSQSKYLSSINFLLTVYFFMLLLSFADVKIKFFEKFFQKHCQSCVGPDLGPNCLQRLSANNNCCH